MLRLTETTRAFAVSAFALAVTYAGNAAGPELILPGGGAYVVQINDDCTLTVDADVDVEYESFSVTGSGKLTLAGEGKITAGSVEISDGITLVNCGQLNSVPVAVGADAVFEIAAPMTWTNAISGAGGVRVSADEVVFNKQSTFTGGLTVAPGGRARSNVGASLGGGGGGGFGGVATYDSGINTNRFYGDVTVESGGAADMIRNHYLSCYSLYLSGTGINGSGAAFRSGGISDAENQPHAMALTLTDDATVCADNAWGLIAPSFAKTQLNLADRTLTITGTNNFLLCNTTITGTGTIEIADGATLKTCNKSLPQNDATCRIKSGGRLYLGQTAKFERVVCEAGSTIKFESDKLLKLDGSLDLPSDGSVTLDISSMSNVEPGDTRTLIECSSVTSETDISRLNVAGKTGYLLKAVADTGIVVEHSTDLPDNLVWSNGSWNVGLEDMSRYSEAAIVLSEGENVVELPGDLSFDEVTVSAGAAATASFSGHTATIANLVLGENVTFVNNGLLNSAPVAVGTNAVFEIAAPMTWSHAISGEGGVRVSADEVVFAAQSTFKGGLKVAAGGRARTTVSATAGGGYGGVKSSGRFTGGVTVESGGAVDMANCYDCSYYSLCLAGTGIAGSGAAYLSCGADNPQDSRQVKSITLTDDATVRSDDAWGLVPSTFDEARIDLGGHTLSIAGTNDFLLGSTEISGDGTIEVGGGVTLKAAGRVWENNRATCSIKGGGGLYVDRYPVSFSNIVCAAGSKITFGDANRDNETLQAGDTFALPSEGYVTIDISAMPDVDAGGKLRLIKCGSITAATDISCLHVAGKTDYSLKAEAGRIVAVRLPSGLAWSDGSWNVDPEDMPRYSEAAIALSGGTNEVAVADGIKFDRVTVSAAALGTLLFTGGTAGIGDLDLGANVTYVHTGAVSNNVVYVRSGAGIASESDGLVANAVSLAMGTTVYRGAKTVNAETISVSTGGVVPMSSAPRLRGNGNGNTILIRNTTGEDPAGLWRVIGGGWSNPRPDSDVFVFEPELPQGAGNRVVADDGLYFARASFTASTGEVSAHESAQDAVDAAEGKNGKITVLANGESVALGSSSVTIALGTGVAAVTVIAGGVIIAGTDSGDGSSTYDPKDGVARAEVVETGKKYSSLSLAKSNMGDEPCTFRLLAESGDSIHLATASEESGQTLLLNNWPYSGTVTGASANLAANSSVKSYYAILSGAKSAWTSGDTVNLLSDGERYSVPNGKTLVLDGEKTYAVAKPFDLSGTLTVGGCTFTASAGITINAGTLKAAKANCTLIDRGTEVTLREGGVKVDTDGYSADIAAALTVAGGLQNKPVILKAGLADLRLSGGVVGDSVITIQSGCGKVFAPASSDCEPGDYTQISEQDAEWATFENGIAVANLVKADGSSTAYSSMNAAGTAAQLNPTYRYIEVLVNNQTLRCLPTMGVIRVKYDNAVFVFKVQSLAQDWTFDEVYGVAFSVFTPVHKATDYVWDGGQDGEWDAMGNWKINMALEYDLPIATRIPDTNDTVTIRADGMPEAGWSASIGSSGGACKEIKVEEGAKLTLSYTSLGCDIAKTGPGTIVVTNAWTSGTPAITVSDDGGTVTLPKTAAYTRGTDTVVVTETDDTVTLGFAGDITDPYAVWAAEHGITGAWDEADESGVYNVFRYLFDKATGEFKIIDISLDAEGNVVITTAEVVNPEGFAVSVVETSDLAGNSVTDEKTIATSSNTATFSKSAPVRFYRVKAVRTNQ